MIKKYQFKIAISKLILLRLEHIQQRVIKYKEISHVKKVAN